MRQLINIRVNNDYKTLWRGEGQKGAANEWCIDERVKYGFNILITKYPGFPGIAKRPIARFAEYWRLYAQVKEPSNPAPSKGVPMKDSGRGLSRLDADVSDFFYKINKARLKQIKQPIKDKPVLEKKPESNEKKDPK